MTSRFLGRTRRTPGRTYLTVLAGRSLFGRFHPTWRRSVMPPTYAARVRSGSGLTAWRSTSRYGCGGAGRIGPSSAPSGKRHGGRHDGFVSWFASRFVSCWLSWSSSPCCGGDGTKEILTNGSSPMVRPSSIPPARVVRLRAKLSPRDVGVLASLHRVRLLSLKQIQRLIVVDGSPRARTRRAQLMMTRLTELGVVTRFSRIVGGVRAGSSGYIYSLSGLGQAVLNTGGPLGGRRRVWESKPYFQDHMLAVSELYVQLVERHRLGRGDLLAYDAEPANWRHFTGSGGELVQIKPDAYARIGRAAIEHSSFIEVDMSTETLPTIQKKSQRYIDYWRSGMEQQWRGVFPRVVWLVQSQQRAEKIRGVIGRFALDTQALFTVGLLGDGPQLLGGSEQGAVS
ncbi:hypothetical protein F3K32_35950 [Streptomyces sp. LBUM 1483]|nr:hypothetical protein [Streptomyces sp. LBUM 1481]MBP5925492.1 hypothetical protein [Streptomyces sp. LBUM 1483]